MTADPLAHALASGGYAREAGRGRDTCPLYGIHAEAAHLRARWREGWDQEDNRIAAARRAKAATNPFYQPTKKQTRRRAR